MPSSENVAAAIAAAVGGMTATTTLMPLDTIKTRMQSRNDGTASITSTFNDLITEGGIGGLFKGLGLKVGESAITKSMYYYAFLLLGGGNFSSVWGELAAGYVAEVLHLPFTVPLECLANRMQASSKKLSFDQALNEVLQESGPLGLYKGMGAYIGVSLQPAIHFGIFEEIKKRLLGGRTQLTFLESFVYAGFARAVSTMMIYPYIRAKVLCQTSTGKAKSSMEVIGGELKKNGVVGLYAGIKPELIRGVMSTALMLAVKEKINGVVLSMLFRPKAAQALR